MTKKILFICSITISAGVLIFLLIFKSFKNNEEEIKHTGQTIIPVVSSKTSGITEDDNETGLPEMKIFIELNKDEIFVDALSADLNGDGAEDQIIAIKKMLDPFVYLIPSVQNPITKEVSRITEIKTNITLPKSLSFYTIDLQDSLPALVYSGMSTDKSRILVIYFIKMNKQDILSFNMAADLRADVQIEMIDGREALRGTLNDYRIHTYNFDPAAPDTLNQIKTEYKWNDSTNRFVKINEIKIPGEKIESSFFRKLSSGSAETFKEFLSGLWFQPTSLGVARSLYFDDVNNVFIFHVDNIQEIYNITSILPRRYGVSLITSNKSISSIKRRIEIELKSVEEISLRVVEDVARLKIGTASNWDGIYRKKSSHINSINKDKEEPLHERNIFSESSQWVNDSGYFKTEMFSYKIKTEAAEETGLFNFVKTKNFTVMQLRSSKGENSFYTVETERDKNSGKILLKMTPVNIGFYGAEANGGQTLIFEEVQTGTENIKK